MEKKSLQIFHVSLLKQCKGKLSLKDIWMVRYTAEEEGMILLRGREEGMILLSSLT